MDEEKFWNEEYWKKNLAKKEEKNFDFLEDIWLEKYQDILEKIQKNDVLDLGCGLGQFTSYFLKKGFNVTSADIAENALKYVKKNNPKTNCVKLNMKSKLPFEESQFEIVFANLSIHYFDDETTKSLVKEIYRILKPNGYFIGSVNSSKCFFYIEKEAKEIEPNFYIAEGRPVRLFDRAQFDKYFDCFENVQLNEIETTRWGNKKYMWEFIYKK